MKFPFVIFLILGFIGIAVFGIFAMDFAMDGGEYGHDGCIAAIAQGGNCPGWQSGLFLLIFHLDAFRGFSTAVFSDYFASAYVSLFAWLSIAVVGFSAGMRRVASELAANCRRIGFADLSYFQARQTLAYWLALHENSPQLSVWRIG